MTFEELKTIYEKLISEEDDVSISSDSIKELTIQLYESYCIPEPQYLNGWKLVNEVVEDPELTPIPKNVLIDIVSKLKSDNCILKIPYSYLYKLLKKYDYEYFNELKENLLKYSKYDSGYLYIVLSSLDLKNSYESNKTIQLMLSKMPKESVIRFFSIIMKNPSSSRLNHFNFIYRIIYQ